MLAPVCAPSIVYDIDIFTRIYLEYFLKELGNNKTIFPVIKSIMPFPIMQVSGNKQVCYSFYFLPVRDVIIPPKYKLLTAIFLYCSLAFLIKRQNN